MFAKIVIGLDGSDHAHNALRVACELAGKFGSELHLVHTPQAEMLGYAMGAVAGYHAVAVVPDPDELKEVGEKVLGQGQAVVAEFKLPKATEHLTLGDPANEIIRCAETCGADLIVTGRRGLGAFGALVQGSTTTRVNHKAQCACLSVV
ncbi:MAG: universal stress protein [Roseovarius sp.]